MLKLGKIFGIPISVHASWLVIFGLLSYGIGADYILQIYPDTSDKIAYLYSSITSLILFFCLLIHEIAHSLAARSFGINTKSIMLFLFGGTAEFENDPQKWTHELCIALAGPTASCLCAGLCAVGWLTFEYKSIYETLALYLVLSNLLIAAINLLPGFPLDGGRAARAILWGISANKLSATRITTIAGSSLGWITAAVGIIAIAIYGDIGGVWWCLIGWFVSNAASESWEHEKQSNESLKTSSTVQS